MRPLNQENEEMIPESPNLPGNGTENSADESEILADQDETMMADADVDGTDEYGLDNIEFANGEIDLKEQMDRATANMDARLHRPMDKEVTPHSRAGNVDTTGPLQHSMSSRNDKH